MQLFSFIEMAVRGVGVGLWERKSINLDQAQNQEYQSWILGQSLYYGYWNSWPFLIDKLAGVQEWSIVMSFCEPQLRLYNYTRLSVYRSRRDSTRHSQFNGADALDARMEFPLTQSMYVTCRIAIWTTSIWPDPHRVRDCRRRITVTSCSRDVPICSPSTPPPPTFSLSVGCDITLHGNAIGNLHMSS